MPGWRKFLYSLMFFFMVATAEIGNIIGEYSLMFFFMVAEAEK